MKRAIFDQICFKRAQLLKKLEYHGENEAWQFVEIDVGLLLKERAELIKLLSRCHNLMYDGQPNGLWHEINLFLEEKD